MTKCFNQREVTRKRDRQTGLDNVNHQITDVKNLTIDGASLTVLNIQFMCDKKITPWCICDENTTNLKNSVNVNNSSTKTGKKQP